MKEIKNTDSTRSYWQLRYQEARTGWDIGYPSIPLKSYIDQLADRDIKILVPGAGNAYEATYLFQQGFKNTYVLDISEIPLQQFAEKLPDFPKSQILCEDFFHHQGQYDLILEQTFFCSFPPLPDNRQRYAQHMYDLLAPTGKLVGLWFDIPLTGDLEKRPFGGTKEEYLSYFSPLFKVKSFDKCYNSIEPRSGNELFGIFEREA